MENYVSAIYEFINEMGYINNEHVLGVFFYGSYLTGLNHKKSDIDMHVVFDDYDENHLIRGVKYHRGMKIEYFEKPINDLYLSIDKDFENRNIAWLPIIGTSKIIFDKTGDLKKLQDYAKTKFEKPLPKLDDNTAKEYVSIINNRMEKLEKSLNENTPDFEHLYHLTIEKIRKFYHDINGLGRVNTSKVFRVYTDEKYRKSYSGYNNPEQEFIDLYIDAMTDISSSAEIRFEKVKNLYEYAKRNIYLDDEYRILIKSRNRN